MMISYFIQWHDIRSDIYLQSYRQPRLGHFMHQKVRDMSKHEHMRYVIALILVSQLINAKQCIIKQSSDDIDKYIGKYMQGWDEVRKERHAKLIKQGIIPASWSNSPRDDFSQPWEDVPNKEWEDSRMATYAAQIEIMDHGIGQIVETLRETEMYDNTVIFFLSDNGGQLRGLHLY